MYSGVWLFEPLFIFQILTLTILFTIFLVEKGYFSAPLKVPTVPSSHCKRTAFDNSVPTGPCFTAFDLHWTGPGALRYPS